MEENLSSNIFGGWKIADMKPVNLPQRVTTAFTGALESFVGSNYDPVLYCGKQVVNGINYAIICKQSIPAAGGAVERVALVTINENTSEKVKTEKKYRVLSVQNILG